MKTHQKTVGKSDEWLTPPEIIKALGEFDLDPADAFYTPFKTAKKSIVKYLKYDGLIDPWSGRIWLNPPFNRYERPKWMKKMS